MDRIFRFRPLSALAAVFLAALFVAAGAAAPAAAQQADPDADLSFWTLMRQSGPLFWMPEADDAWPRLSSLWLPADACGGDPYDTLTGDWHNESCRDADAGVDWKWRIWAHRENRPDAVKEYATGSSFDHDDLNTASGTNPEVNPWHWRLTGMPESQRCFPAAKAVSWENAHGSGWGGLQVSQHLGEWYQGRQYLPDLVGGKVDGLTGASWLPYGFFDFDTFSRPADPTRHGSPNRAGTCAAVAVYDQFMAGAGGRTDEAKACAAESMTLLMRTNSELRCEPDLEYWEDDDAYYLTDFKAVMDRHIAEDQAPTKANGWWPLPDAAVTVDGTAVNLRAFLSAAGADVPVQPVFPPDWADECGSGHDQVHGCGPADTEAKRAALDGDDGKKQWGSRPLFRRIELMVSMPGEDEDDSGARSRPASWTADFEGYLTAGADHAKTAEALRGERVAGFAPAAAGAYGSREWMQAQLTGPDGSLRFDGAVVSDALDGVLRTGGGDAAYRAADCLRLLPPGDPVADRQASDEAAEFWNSRAWRECAAEAFDGGSRQRGGTVERRAGGGTARLSAGTTAVNTWLRRQGGDASITRNAEFAGTNFDAAGAAVDAAGSEIGANKGLLEVPAANQRSLNAILGLDGDDFRWYRSSAAQVACLWGGLVTTDLEASAKAMEAAARADLEDALDELVKVQEAIDDELGEESREDVETDERSFESVCNPRDCIITSNSWGALEPSGRRNFSCYTGTLGRERRCRCQAVVEGQTVDVDCQAAAAQQGASDHPTTRTCDAWSLIGLTYDFWEEERVDAACAAPTCTRWGRGRGCPTGYRGRFQSCEAGTGYEWERMTRGACIADQDGERGECYEWSAPDYSNAYCSGRGQMTAPSGCLSGRGYWQNLKGGRAFSVSVSQCPSSAPAYCSRWVYFDYCEAEGIRRYESVCTDGTGAWELLDGYRDLEDVQCFTTPTCVGWHGSSTCEMPLNGWRADHCVQGGPSGSNWQDLPELRKNRYRDARCDPPSGPSNQNPVNNFAPGPAAQPAFGRAAAPGAAAASPAGRSGGPGRAWFSWSPAARGAAPAAPGRAAFGGAPAPYDPAPQAAGASAALPFGSPVAGPGRAPALEAPGAAAARAAAGAAAAEPLGPADYRDGARAARDGAALGSAAFASAFGADPPELPDPDAGFAPLPGPGERASFSGTPAGAAPEPIAGLEAAFQPLPRAERASFADAAGVPASPAAPAFTGVQAAAAAGSDRAAGGWWGWNAGGEPCSGGVQCAQAVQQSLQQAADPIVSSSFTVPASFGCAGNVGYTSAECLSNLWARRSELAAEVVRHAARMQGWTAVAEYRAAVKSGLDANSAPYLDWSAMNGLLPQITAANRRVATAGLAAVNPMCVTPAGSAELPTHGLGEAGTARYRSGADDWTQRWDSSGTVRRDSAATAEQAWPPTAALQSVTVDGETKSVVPGRFTDAAEHRERFFGETAFGAPAGGVFGRYGAATTQAPQAFSAADRARLPRTLVKDDHLAGSSPGAGGVQFREFACPAPARPGAYATVEPIVCQDGRVRTGEYLPDHNTACTKSCPQGEPDCAFDENGCGTRIYGEPLLALGGRGFEARLAPSAAQLALDPMVERFGDAYRHVCTFNADGTIASVGDGRVAAAPGVTAAQYSGSVYRFKAGSGAEPGSWERGHGRGDGIEHGHDPAEGYFPARRFYEDQNGDDVLFDPFAAVDNYADLETVGDFRADGELIDDGAGLRAEHEDESRVDLAEKVLTAYQVRSLETRFHLWDGVRAGDHSTDDAALIFGWPSFDVQGGRAGAAERAALLQERRLKTYMQLFGKAPGAAEAESVWVRSDGPMSFFGATRIGNGNNGGKGGCILEVNPPEPYSISRGDAMAFRPVLDNRLQAWCVMPTDAKPLDSCISIPD